MIIVEDGTNVTDAVSYLSVIDADAYHTKYNQLDWAGTDEEKEAALIVAAKSLDMLYGPKLRSVPLYSADEQSLAFPRYTYFDKYGKQRLSTTIPTEIKQAQAEIALMYMAGVEVFPEDNQSNGIQQESVKVGDIQTSTTYKSQPVKATYDGFRKIDLILAPLLATASNVTRLGM